MAQHRIIQRNGTAAELATRNEILLNGELCFESDTSLYKLGDGVSTWSSLPYFSLMPVLPSAVTLATIPDPGIPAIGSMRLYAQDNAGRAFLKILGPSGLDNPIQAGMHSNAIRMLSPGTGAVPSYLGLPTITTIGTMSHPVIANGFDLNSSISRMRITSAATANSASNIRFSVPLCYRGESFAGLGTGGFFVSTRFCVVSGSPTHRAFVGLMTSTAAIPVTQDPALLTNAVGVGWAAGDTNLQMIYNDATGSATKIDLGPNFPNSNGSAVYELSLFAQSNGDSIGYRVKRLDSPAVASGVLTTDIPGKSQMLTYQAYLNNGGTAAAVILDVHRFYLESDY